MHTMKMLENNKHDIMHDSKYHDKYGDKYDRQQINMHEVKAR